MDITRLERLLRHAPHTACHTAGGISKCADSATRVQRCFIQLRSRRTSFATYEIFAARAIFPQRLGAVLPRMPRVDMFDDDYLYLMIGWLGLRAQRYSLMLRPQHFATIYAWKAPPPSLSRLYFSTASAVGLKQPRSELRFDARVDDLRALSYRVIFFRRSLF